MDFEFKYDRNFKSAANVAADITAVEVVPTLEVVSSRDNAFIMRLYRYLNVA